MVPRVCSSCICSSRSSKSSCTCSKSRGQRRFCRTLESHREMNSRCSNLFGHISFPDTFFWESWRGIQFWRTLESQREISFWDIHMYFTRMGRFVIFKLRGSHLQSNRNLLVSQCWRNPLEICRASRFYSSLTLPRLATMWDELKMQFYGQLPRCPVPHSSLPATQRPTTFSQPLLCKIQSLSLEICNVCGDPSWPK